MLVKAGPNAEVRRLVFSNLSLLWSFLNLDSIPEPGAAARDEALASARGTDGDAGARPHLELAGPVARLVRVVVEGDAELVTQVSDEHLTLLARGAARTR